jgi:endonuclease-3
MTVDHQTKRLAAIYRALSETYLTYEEMDDPWMANGLSATPFRHLVSGCLSTVTVTKRVVSACVPLYARVSTFSELLALDDEELRDLIRPVAHYNRKTANLKIMCRQIIEQHGGEIPSDRESLLKLQGVGRKVADLVMNHLFSEDSIAVDTHVLRVLQRLEIVEDTTAEKAADTINAITPAEYKRHAHEWLIQLGMQVCHARSPNCNSCIVLNMCPTGASAGGILPEMSSKALRQ